MAWTQTDGGQVEVIPTSGDPFWLKQTSLCTINLYEQDTSRGDQLRMFGVDAGIARTQATNGYPDEYICYLDAETDGVVPRFVVHGTNNAATSNLFATVVPTRKCETEKWHYTKVYYGPDEPAVETGWVEDMGDGRWEIHDQLADMDVWYKDPCVIHLPKGWLMVLSRVRQIRDSACTVEQGEEHPRLENATPEGCLSDIVGYWAEEDDPGFEGAVKGPYWLAVNISSLGTDTTGIRFWLSVPGAAMVSPHTLAIYFVAEKTLYTGGVSDSDPATVQRTFSELAWADRHEAGEFISTIGVHLIELDDFMAMPYGNEKEWALSTNNRLYHPTRVASRIYLWMDNGAQPDTELVDLPGAETLKLVDPQCARCSLDAAEIGIPELLRLFVGSNGRSGEWAQNQNPLHGLWMARAFDQTYPDMPRREPSSTGYGPSVDGIDFVAMGTEPFRPALYPPETEEEHAYENPIDPDPVMLSSGRWRVGFGVLYPGAETEEPLALAEVTTANRTVCSNDWTARDGPLFSWSASLDRRIDRPQT